MRRAAAAVAAFLARLVAPFRPEPGTTEGAVFLGMALLAIGFLLAGLFPLAFLVPGAILVVLGSLPAFVAARKG